VGNACVANRIAFLSLSSSVVFAVFVLAQLVGAVSAWLPMRNAADTEAGAALAAD